MYQLNNLMRDVLITPAEVIYHATTKHSLDVRTIANSIIIAEERFIRPELGDALYSDLVAKKNRTINDDSLTSLQAKFSNDIVLEPGQVVNALEFLPLDDLTLWRQILWKLTAEAVILVAFPENYVQFGSDGVVMTAPPAGPMTSGGIVSPDLRTMKWARDTKLQDRIVPLTESLHSFICASKAKYPLYDRMCPCDLENNTSNRKSDFILGIYDDPEEDHCKCKW